MKKIIIILMLVGLFLTGCGEKKEEQKQKDYSKFTFSDVSWTRDGGNDIETIRFSSNGKFTYYCSCGNPVNDSDLCESYTYNEETKEIKYHTDPVNAILEPYMNQSKEEYRSFENPTFLNFIEDMFIGNDGHLYVLYSSSKYRYIGDADNEGEFYIQNIRYVHVKEDGTI